MVASSGVYPPTNRIQLLTAIPEPAIPAGSGYFIGHNMSKTEQPSVEFEGEEAGAGFASPTLDLISAGALIALSALVMIASLKLPVPGSIRSAPGLLPFIVAASLMVMSFGLGATAWTRRRNSKQEPIFVGREAGTDLRTLRLAVAVAAYIAVLHILGFQYNLVIFGIDLRLTAFEPATIIALSTIIAMHWNGPLWITVSVSAGWALVLSLVFQLVFKIPLPGSF